MALCGLGRIDALRGPGRTRDWRCSTSRWCGSIAGETSPVIAGPRLLHRDRGLPGDQRLRAGWPSGPPRSSAGAPSSPGCSPSPASARCTAASCCGCSGAWADALDEFELARPTRYREVGAPDAAGLAAYETGRRAPAAGRARRGRRGATSGGRPRLRPAAGPGPAVARPGQSGRAGIAAIDRLLAEPGRTGPALPPAAGAVEVLLAAGDVDRARTLAGELERDRRRLRLRRRCRRPRPRRSGRSSSPPATPPARSPTCARRTSCGRAPRRPYDAGACSGS